jgi:peroxiredoxin
LGQLQEIEPRLVELGYQIVAISPDSPEKVRAVSTKKGYSFRLLSDSDLKAARAMGVAYQVDDETFRLLKQYDIDIEAASGRTHRLLPVPSVFILDKKGVIQYEYVNPDYKVRLEGDVLLAAAEAAVK